MGLITLLLANSILLANAVLALENHLMKMELLSKTADPSYDHQISTYRTTHKPVVEKNHDDLTLTPYFSPVTSSSTMVELIEGAKESIDIGTPGFSSWSGCTPYLTPTQRCMRACSPSDQRAEKFPVFAALLNALHRGVAVRILTNNYNIKDCKGTISPLPFLKLNGANIRYYASTTFLHEKYMNIDGGKKVSISSINFSQTSFRYNREAGIVLSGSKGAADFVASVFDSDWRRGATFPSQANAGWSESDLAIIQSEDQVPVVLPDPKSGLSDYYSPPDYNKTTHGKGFSLGSDDTLTVLTSPDFSAKTLSEQLLTAKKTLDIHIYQITSDWIANAIESLLHKGVKVRLLVSGKIYGEDDCNAANAVYKKLVYNVSNSDNLVDDALSIYKTTFFYSYSHQKYWVIDGEQVGLSTGNMSPSDFHKQTLSSKEQDFPVYGKYGWEKLNRDFTILVKSTSTSKFVQVFEDMFNGDSDLKGTFPEKVYEWNNAYPVQCGSG
eukprot:g755.t1